MVPAVLLYDEDCGFCTRSARFLERAARGRLRIVPIGSAEGARLLADLCPAERYTQAWLVWPDRPAAPGERLGGDRAIWAALYLVPGGGLLRPLQYLPGFAYLSRALYRWVANRRPTTCRLRKTPSP